MDKLLNEYLKTLTEKEKKAYEIANSHLGYSFHLGKSVGFIKWCKIRTTRNPLHDQVKG